MGAIVGGVVGGVAGVALVATITYLVIRSRSHSRSTRPSGFNPELEAGLNLSQPVTPVS